MLRRFCKDTGETFEMNMGYADSKPLIAPYLDYIITTLLSNVVIVDGIAAMRADLFEDAIRGLEELQGAFSDDNA